MNPREHTCLYIQGMTVVILSILPAYPITYDTRFHTPACLSKFWRSPDYTVPQLPNMISFPGESEPDRVPYNNPIPIPQTCLYSLDPVKNKLIHVWSSVKIITHYSMMLHYWVFEFASDLLSIVV